MLVSFHLRAMAADKRVYAHVSPQFDLNRSLLAVAMIERC